MTVQLFTAKGGVVYVPTGAPFDWSSAPARGDRMYFDPDGSGQKTFVVEDRNWFIYRRELTVRIYLREVES